MKPTPTPALARSHAHDLLRQMLLIRRFEERSAELYMQGKIRGFLHLSIGQEAVAVGALAAVAAEDRIVAAYREHGHALARGVPPAAVMAEMFGKATGCSRGRGGSMHLFDVAHGIYGGNAIVAGGLPLAVGLALADALQGRPHVTLCFFGDGAVAEGEFHESLNLAALWNLPVLFLCENNRYAMGTALVRHQAMPIIHRKGAAYGVESAVVDGMDVLAVEAAVRLAVESVRGTRAPYLLEARTYRFRAHSMYDPELYRPKEEVERWRARDPLATFPATLQGWGLVDDGELRQLEAAAAAAVDAAVAAAEAAAWEPVEDLTRDVLTPAPGATP
ncbi:MAG: pyruvate dehydrogenase (acetyl-transferring) E1 component subunit alpha [Planctomycetia bacterium]